MQKNKTLILLLVAFVVGVLAKSFLFNNSAGSADSADAVIESIMTRSSVRSYTDQPIEADKVDKMLRAAMAAPTAMNRQPWCFYVVEDRAMLDEMGANLKNAQMLSKAQMAILVCGDMSLAAKGISQQFWIQDCSAATENLLLAAHAMGLGAVWTGVHPTPEKLAAVKGYFKLPKEHIPLSLVAIGYPDSEPTIKDKWDEEKVFYVK